MKAYKGFNRDMTCRGFQFEEGKEYHEEKAELCESGFHACENPLDTFRYYSPNGSVYHEVELDEVSDERNEEDTKICAKTIRIGARLDVAGMCKAHHEYVRARCKQTCGRVAGSEESAAADNLESAAAGYRGSSCAGHNGVAAAGYRGSAAAGYKGVSAAGCFGSASAFDNGSSAAGEHGAASAGNYGVSAAGYNGISGSGNWGIAAAGNWGSAAAGNLGIAASGINGSASAGWNGLACCRGGKVMGGMGAIIVCSELNNRGENISVAAAIVDGKKIKANTWYTVKNGEFVEVK